MKKNTEIENAEAFKNRLIIGGLSEEQKQRVTFAYQISKEAHRRQVRDDGCTRYFEHPRKGCLVLMDELKIYDYRLLIAFLFHDVGEDTQLLGSILTNYNSWKKEATFRLDLLCEGVAPLVIGMTKPVIDNIIFFSKKEAFEYYIDQLKNGLIEVKILKMVDRLINLRDMLNCSPEKVKKQIIETETVYLPVFSTVCEDQHYGKAGEKLLQEICDILKGLKTLYGISD